MQAVELDITGTLDKYNKLASSMPYIISKASNEVAFKRGRKALSKDLNSSLDIKAKAMTKVNAIKFTRSTKNNLSNTLYFHLGRQSDTSNPLNQMMELQQKGGTESSNGGKMAIPIRGNMAKYAGLPRSKEITNKSPLGIDKVMKKVHNRGKINKKRVFATSKGVYLGVGKEIKMIYFFEDKTKHDKKLLNFQKAAENVYSRNFERYFEREYLKVLKG